MDSLRAPTAAMNSRRSAVLSGQQLAIRRAVTDATRMIFAEECWASTRLEKLFRVEKYAIHELALLMPEVPA